MNQKIRQSAGNAALEALNNLNVSGVTVTLGSVSGVEKDALRGLVDSLRSQGSGVVILWSVLDQKPHIVAGVTPELTGRINAGLLIKALAPIVGGRGGGRADFAEAGGKDSSTLDQLRDASIKALEGLLAVTPKPQG